MRKILEQCPSCGGELIVTHLRCTACDTVIIGKYTPGPFNKLTPDDYHFLEVFVICRGNLKDMERELGVNYSTVRNRLSEVVRRLGYEVNPDVEEDLQQQRRHILRALERGEVTVAEAEDLLAQLRLGVPPRE